MVKRIIGAVRNAKVVFIVLTAFYVLHALVRWLSVSVGRIATHFSTDGTPNDSMTGAGFVLFHLAMAVFFTGIRWFIATSSQWQQGINMPSGYYELSMPQKQVFVSFMEEHSWKFGCLLMGMLIAIDGLIIWANAQVPANLPLVMGLMLTFIFLGGIGWWIVSLLLAIKRIVKQNASTK
jgi:hypothetical protein